MGSDGRFHVPVVLLRRERNARGTSRRLSQQAAPAHGERHLQQGFSESSVFVRQPYRPQERGLRSHLATASLR
jgi:hypothetical protein